MKPFSKRWLRLSGGLLLVFAGGSSIYLKLKRPAVSVDVGYVEKLLKMPEEEIDIGIVALNLEKWFIPEVGIASHLKMLDDLADAIKEKTHGAQDPDFRIRVMNTILYREMGYGFDYGTDDNKDSDEDALLHHALDTKLVNCMSMSLIYLAVAQRLGYPIYPVLTPTHMFLRYVAPDLTTINIEAVHVGEESSDQDYIRDFAISKKTLESGLYIRTISNRQFVGNMLSWYSGYSDDSQWHINNIIATLRASIKMNPWNDAPYFKLAKNVLYGRTYHGLGNAIGARNEAIELDKKGLELGNERTRKLILGDIEL